MDKIDQKEPWISEQKLRSFLENEKLGLSDESPSKSSIVQFEAGGHYGIELSSVNNVQIMRYAIDAADRGGIRINRCDECRGIQRLPDAEIREMVSICRDRGIGLIMSIGPRAIYDTGGFVRTENGCRMGYRLRGMRGITHALADVTRAVELGVRGFLVYDEGLLLLLQRARTTGFIPPNCVFKLSVHCGCSNPSAARVYESIGADTINPVPDLDVGMLAAIRQAIRCPIDVFTDTSHAAGGIIRTHDVPQIVRRVSPVYLKCGAVSQPKQNHLPCEGELSERVKQAICVSEAIQRRCPEAKQIGPRDRTLGIPE